ncbi:MAG: helix-turn-helix transcriptional regulator [Pseudomonadota bacterium]
MDDLEKHIKEFKKKHSMLADGFETGYENFKIGAILKMAREEAGLTQEQIAQKIGTYKTNISRLENHGDDAKFSTIQRYASALGKKIKIAIV